MAGAEKRRSWCVNPAAAAHLSLRWVLGLLGSGRSIPLLNFSEQLLTTFCRLCFRSRRLRGAAMGARCLGPPQESASEPLLHGSSLRPQWACESVLGFRLSFFMAAADDKRQQGVWLQDQQPHHGTRFPLTSICMRNKHQTLWGFGTNL